ncbi:type II CAAX prenyl endopeptidase Rce1 family protein [Phenylobacterium sp.]|uniref:CPBP family glutamic-type intramembrane protease n=1 Tax=Phenylobacterium sp. TaxID=1871053 RepID=UPI0035B2DC31
MLAFARRRPVAAHFLLSFLIASLTVAVGAAAFALDPPSAGVMGEMVQHILASPGYANILTIGVEAAKKPLLITVFVFAAAPTISALLLASAGAGGGLKRLLSRLRPIGPEGAPGRAIRLYLILLAVYAFGLFAYDWISGPGVDALHRLRGFGVGVVFGALIGLFVDEGGTLEETGWRGFEWPNLQDSMRSPLAAALLLGVMHWAWHLPREALTILGGAQLGSFLVGQATFMALCVALSVVAVFCVNQSGGSIWPAVFVHGGSNVWSKAAGDTVTATFGLFDPRSMILIVLAILIAIFAHRRMGRAPGAASRA